MSPGSHQCPAARQTDKGALMYVCMWSGGATSSFVIGKRILSECPNRTRVTESAEPNDDAVLLQAGNRKKWFN